MKKAMIWLLVLIVLIGALPVLSAFAASAIAGALGCALDEGSAHPCLLGGVDIGETLTTMFVMHWFGLMTIPFAGLALAIWLIVAVVLVLVRWRRGRAT